MEAFREILSNYQAFGLIAFVVTVFATPLAGRVAQRLGVMDIPDQVLKPHARPTPYLGGAAICLGWIAALLAALLGTSVAVEAHLLLPILAGGVAFAALGLADDARNLSPKFRLIVGTLVIAGVLIATKTGFRLVDSILSLVGIHDVPGVVAVPLSFLISIFIVLGACNSTNLIDGLNGLCTGVTGIISFGFFLLAAVLAIYYPSKEANTLRLVLAIAMFGATMGFLPFNFYGKIFMGDGGSMLLGYNCGIMILLFAEWGNFRWVVGALMIFALPVFDTALALYRRLRSGRSIFEGDRSHFYDQLVQRGFSVRQSVLLSYGLTIIFVALGMLVIGVRMRYALIVYVSMLAVASVIAWAGGLTHPEELPQPAPSADGEAKSEDPESTTDS